MKELDFLPHSYHCDTVRRRRWRRGVALFLLVLCMVATAVTGRLLRTHRVPREAEAEQTASPATTSASAANRLTVQPASDDEAIRQAAAGLTLQSTRGGSKPLATISGRIVGLGETVEGFVVERIEADRVTIRRGVVRVTLRLRKGTHE